jgi:hypothetical protein
MSYSLERRGSIFVYHYRTQDGKGHKALGKAFAECHTRHTSHGKILVGKEDFAECFCRVLKKHSAKNEPKRPPKNSKNNFFTGEVPPASAPAVSVVVTGRGIFHTKFTCYAAGRILTRDLSFVRSPLYHCTTLSLVSRFRLVPHILY